MVETQHVAKVAREYQASQEKVRHDLRSVAARIVVRQQKVELHLSKQALLKAFLTSKQSEGVVASLSASDNLITLEADAQLTRCRDGVRLLLAATEQTRAPCSISRFDKRYISKIISLAF